MSDSPEVCPHCRSSMQGEPIPEKYRVHADDHDEQVARYGRCYCFPYGLSTTHFSRQIGHEISGVYDGILFWHCPDCGKAWPRWTDGGRLTEAAKEYVDKWNAGLL